MAVVKRWVIIIAVRPATNSRKRDIHSASAQESIALVGSSKRTISDCRKKALARAIFCHSPTLKSAVPNHLPRTS